MGRGEKWSQANDNTRGQRSPPTGLTTAESHPFPGHCSSPTRKTPAFEARPRGLLKPSESCKTFRRSRSPKCPPGTHLSKLSPIVQEPNSDHRDRSHPVHMTYMCARAVPYRSHMANKIKIVHITKQIIISSKSSRYVVHRHTRALSYRSHPANTTYVLKRCVIQIPCIVGKHHLDRTDRKRDIQII